MKTMRGPTWKLFTSLLAVLVIVPACRTVQEGEAAFAAKVVRIKGQACYTSGALSRWQVLKVGTVLKSGTIVQTAMNSNMDFTWDANPDLKRYIPARWYGRAYVVPICGSQSESVRLMEDSFLGMDKLTVSRPRGAKERATDIRMDLRSGRIIGHVRKQIPESILEVRFTNGVARVRSGLFGITADGLVCVRLGAVVVTVPRTDQTVELTEGFQFDARTGETTRLPDDVLQYFHY